MRLAEAVASGAIDLVRAMSPPPAMLNDVDVDSGESLIGVAVERGDQRMVRLLLDLGASPDLPTPGLPIAAGANNQKIVELLLGAGANIDAEDELGTTALITAAAAGHNGMVSFLLGRKANPNVKARNGDTAIVAAATAGHWETVKLLEPHSRVSERRRVRVLRDQLEAGFRTPQAEAQIRKLGESAGKGLLDVVGRLLDKGIAVDAAPKGGSPPLSMAANHGRIEVVQLLVTRGADVNKFDQYDETPLSYAARAYTPACFEILWPLSNPASRKVGLRRAMLTKSREAGWQHWVPPSSKAKGK